MRKLIQLLAMAVIAAPGVVHAAAAPCLTAREFTDLSTYALPSIITGTAQRCSGTLGPEAFLKRGGNALAARYAAAKPAAWPGAKAAFLKLSSGMHADAGGIFKALPDDKLQPMVGTLVEGLIAQQVPTERCGAIDRAVRLLSPLPAQNTAELIALAVGLGLRGGGGKVGQIAICAA